MIRLYATSLSHYSRKVRILLELFQLPYQFVDVGNVAQSDSHVFAENPLMKVPALVDGDTWMIESDHIAQYLVRTYDPQDRYRVFEKDISKLNIRAVLNGIMQEEVKFILAQRTGVPVDEFDFFAKAKIVIDQGLNWLEQESDHFNSENPGYLEFHLICLWEHLAYYNILDLAFPKLKIICDKLAKVQTLFKTSPLFLKGNSK